jgi:hypothetical protein
MRQERQSQWWDIYCKLLADFELVLQNIEKLTAGLTKIVCKSYCWTSRMGRDINYLMNFTITYGLYVQTFT